MKIINKSKVGYGKILVYRNWNLGSSEYLNLFKSNFWVIEKEDYNHLDHKDTDVCYCYSPHFDPFDYSIPEYLVEFNTSYFPHVIKIKAVKKVKRNINGTII